MASSLTTPAAAAAATAAAPPPQLHYDPYSVHARLVLIAAQASGIPIAIHETSLATGDNHRPAYLALNPTGQLPTLVDGDVVVYESNAILAYLFAKHASPLYPRDDLPALGAILTAYEHLRQKPWDTANLAAFEDFVKKQFSPRLGDTNAAVVEESLGKLAKRFQFIEAHFFKTHAHHVAATPTARLSLADIALGCVLAQAHAVKGFDLGTYPKLAPSFTTTSRRTSTLPPSTPSSTPASPRSTERRRIAVWSCAGGPVVA